MTSWGLDYGITPWLLRKLCDGEWSGGRGLLPQQLGDMTPNQIWFLWAPVDWFKETDGRVVTKYGSTSAFALLKDGKVEAVAANGQKIKLGPSRTGRSKAGELLEQLRREKAAQQAQQKQRRKRRGT